MERRFNEEDFSDFLKEIINLKMGEPKELGICKQVLDKGYESLSEKQRYVFQKDILDHYYTEKCQICVSEIPWSEMMSAHDNGGNCGWCQNSIEKAHKDN